jgi:hypothetical protein
MIARGKKSMTNSTTSYFMIRLDDMPDYRDAEIIRLAANTDRGARRKAIDMARAAGWKHYVIKFRRSSDYCSGTLNIY